MIEKIFTGITNANSNTSIDFPCAFTDTVHVGSKIYFCCPLSTINSLTGLNINSGNISTINVFSRICTNSSGTPLIEFSGVTPAFIQNNFFMSDISSVTNNITHEFLLEKMSSDEIFKLFKKYFLSCVIGSVSTISSEQLIFNSTHTLQEINFVLNTLNSGPYDVGFRSLDVCNPEDFTLSERQQIFTNNSLLIGGEYVRMFFPTNLPINVKGPLFVYFHGNNQLTENYDSFLSSAASYGYFAMSIPIDQTGVAPERGFAYITKLIDHIKQNESKIAAGLFNNKIDFTKINLGGHSRGGDLAELIALGLKNKSGLKSPVKNVTISHSDIKCIFPMGRVTSTSMGDDGLCLTTGVTLLNPNINTIKYFDRNHNIPTLDIRAKFDNQAGPEAHTSLMFQGYDKTNKVNTIDKGVIIFDNAEHSQLADYYFKDFVNGGPNSTSLQRLETNHFFNSTSIQRNFLASNIIQFMSINNFSNNKLKKLRFIDYRIQPQKNNFGSKIPYHLFFYNKNSDLKHVLDSYSGLTLSLAGSTGFTLPSSLGFTYGFAIDSDYFNALFTTEKGGTFYPNAFNNFDPLFRYVYKSSGGVDYQDPVDDFNGIMDMTYKALLLPIESDTVFGYTFTNVLNLSENNYICLRGALKTFDSAIQSGNTLNSNFTITLIDKNNNSSSLTSKNNSNGFEKLYTSSKVYSNTYSVFSINNSIPNNICFRIGDFALKNTSLGITQINQIRFNFGPSHGSTFCHVVLDEFVIYNEL